jgi:putative spermidine/putrescine transport system ATP-binding protein
MPEQSRGASLELTDLAKHYDDATALNGISLTIPAGEFVTLLGPSGSGKTTTLNMIAGFVRPDAGQIMMDGKPIEGVPPHKRNVGMVFQNYALFPHMTVEANVSFPLKQRKRPKVEIVEKVNEALELVGLAGYGRRYPRELSGGQQQRVALARALVFEPRVLLMDEPLGALDKRLRESLQLEFRRIHKELGITFIYVTHDQGEALVMSDRIAVFNEGKIEQVGGAEDLYERPETLFVARFLGDSNVLAGVVDRQNGTPRLAAEGYRLMIPKQPDVPNGEGAAVVIRPERLAVASADTPAAPGANVLKGRVNEVIYMGGLRRLGIECTDSVRLLCQEQAGVGSSVGVGDEVLISWNPDDTVLLPHAEAAGLHGATVGLAGGVDDASGAPAAF